MRAALKGPHKSAICWEPGGSGGSFGTRGRGAKLTVNTNNQSARPIERLAPAARGGGRQWGWRAAGGGRRTDARAAGAPLGTAAPGGMGEASPDKGAGTCPGAQGRGKPAKEMKDAPFLDLRQGEVSSQRRRCALCLSLDPQRGLLAFLAGERKVSNLSRQ